MPKFYFNVRQSNTLFEDPEGVDLPDLEAAWQWALGDARSLVAEQVLEGHLEGQWIEVTDSNGSIIATLPFGHDLAPQCLA